MLKKQIIIQKGFTFLNKKPIILLYHFNNISIKNWHLLRNKLKKLEDVETLVIQNKIVKKLQSTSVITIDKINHQTSLTFVSQEKQVLQNKNIHELKNLFQGPTFIIGCNTNDQLKGIFNIVKDYSNILFIGGLYNNQKISHYTLDKILKLNDSVKLELIQFLEYKKASILLLENHLISTCSNLTQILKNPFENKKS